MAINQTAGRNIYAAVTRIVRKAWFGADSTVQERAPLALSNESIVSVNNAGTGYVELIKSNASDVTEFVNSNGNLFDGAVTVTGVTALNGNVTFGAGAIGPAPTAAGATLAVTAAMSNSTILLDTAAGSVATLPAATGSGNLYRFVVKTTTTSGAHKILAASSSDFLNGIVTGENAGTAKCFASAAATNHSIQMPYSGSQPSGGFIGDWFTFIDVAPNLWNVSGMYQAGTTPTTPFSSATS